MEQNILNILEENENNWEELIKASRYSTMLDLVKCPVITEKTYSALALNNKHTFDVDKRLTKPQIKKLFKTLFGVNIIRINTLILPKRSIRFAMSSGFKPSYKRVILTLKQGDLIKFDLGN